MQAPATSPSLARFEELLSGISGVLQSQPPGRPPGQDGPHVVQFDVGGEPIGLIYAPEKDPESLTIACTFGALPETGREAVLAQLLKVNYMTVGTGATLAMDPLSEQVVLASQQALEGADPQALLASMGGIAALAAQWREGYFLEGAAGGSPDILPPGMLA